MKTLLICLLLPMVVFGATETFSPPVATIHQNDLLSTYSASPELTSIALRAPQYITQEILLNGETRKTVTLEGEPFCPETGFPAVPQVTRLYRIPNTGGVELVVRNAEFETHNSFKAFPYYDAETETAKLGEQFTRDAWWPPRVAEISEPMIFRDFRIVAVTIYPVQVNAAMNQARLYSSIDVDLVANSSAGENELLTPRAPSPRFAPMYRHLISNLDEDELSSVDRLPGAYLIIAKDNQSVNPWVDSLAMWRRLSGYEVIVDQRLNWTAATMRSTIQDLYANSPIPLEYVALMGDAQSSFGVPTSTDYDHYFALGNSNDELEDFGVSRYPCASSTEFATMWRKLSLYEREPTMDDSTWFRRAVLSASISRELASNATWARWADQQFSMHTGLDDNVVYLHTNSLPSDTFCTLYQQGIGYFLWRGSWIGEISTDFPTRCQSTTKLPVCAFFACAEDVIAKNFVLAGTYTSPKGATAAIGVATAGSHAAYNITTAGGLVYAVANMQIEHVSHALAAAKVWLFATFGVSTSAINHSKWTNMVGDPALSMWTDVPVTFKVEHPDTLPIGASSVTLFVRDSVTEEPIADAVVVLWKGSFNTPETYIRAMTDEFGFVTLPLTIMTDGDLRLCVTKHNHKPYVLEIPCAAMDYNVAAEALFIDDNDFGGTHGNGDEQFNAGETVDLLLLAYNFGTSAITSEFTATISCNRADVTFARNVVRFPALDIAGSALSDSAFRIVLSPSVPNETTLKFVVTFELPTEDVAYTYEYLCFSPNVCFGEQDAHESLLPGTASQLRLSICNDGTVNLVDVDARLVSLSAFVRVDQAAFNYGNIAVDQTTTLFTTFHVIIDSGAFRGQRAPMMMSMVDSSAFRDTIYFDLTLGELTTNDPSGPDEYGYYAYDDEDTGYVNCPAFGYLDISSGLGTDLELYDPGESTTPAVIYSRLVALPFSFTYYGIEYDTITVCANGWVAMGNQGWNDCFRNYPLPGIIGAANMIAPYWDDLKTSGQGHGVWAYYDQTNERFVVQWKATAGSVAYNEADLDFQVVLYDHQMYPTRDGNGMIEFFYNDVTMNLGGGSYSEIPGSTIGIQDAGSVRGLQYCYVLDYAAGAAAIRDSMAIRFTTDGPLAVDSISVARPEPMIPSQLALHQNYPNPFNPSTTIAFELSSASKVRVSIYDLQGRMVENLLEGVLDAGSHAVAFDGAAHASGVYFCRLQTAAEAKTIKMVLLK